LLRAGCFYIYHKDVPETVNGGSAGLLYLLPVKESHHPGHLEAAHTWSVSSQALKSAIAKG